MAPRTRRKPAPKASGANIPEAQRHTLQVKLRLPPDVVEALDDLVAKWGLTRSGAVARLVEERTKAKCQMSPAYCPYCPHCHPRTAKETTACAHPSTTSVDGYDETKAWWCGACGALSWATDAGRQGPWTVPALGQRMADAKGADWKARAEKAESTLRDVVTVVRAAYFGGEKGEADLAGLIKALIVLG